MFRIWKPVYSFRGKLILAFMLLVVLPAMLIFLLYSFNSQKVVEAEIYASNQELAERSAAILNDLGKRMIKASEILQSDFNQIYKIYDKDLSNWQEDYHAYSAMALMQSKMVSNRDILLDSDGFLVFLDNRDLVVTTLYDSNTAHLYQAFSQDSWYHAAMEANGFPAWTPFYRLDSKYGYTSSVIKDGYLVLSRRLRNDTSTEFIGTLAIGILLEPILGETHNKDRDIPYMLLEDKQGLLFDMKGNPYDGLTHEQLLQLNSHFNAAKPQQFEYQSKRYLVNKADISQFGLKLIQFLPYELFTDRLERSKTKSIIGLLATFLIGISLFLLLMIKLTKPIYSLLRAMNLVGGGNFQVAVNVKGKDEISLLGNQFNKMLDRLKELMNNVKEEQLKKEEAQFQALQAQINPHFLFNTLNSIKLMAMLSHTNKDVSDMITALGKLMEFSMKQQRQLVTLRQELEYLELYMSLQKIRYHDSINIDIIAPEHLLDCIVLKFSLQPIVENSIIHGGVTPLQIVIEAIESADGEQLTIIIKDNGKGLSADELTQVQGAAQQNHAKFSGIGISNIDQRIKLHFGPSYGISLSNGLTGGLEARIQLPIRKEPIE